jgi:prolyl oligopeptidase
LDLSEFKTEQVFYPSKDGTKVPMFIVTKKALEKSENNPALLYGYGGFNISLTPTFSVTRLIWLKYFNGVYVSANLRGGGYLINSISGTI